MSLLTRAQAVDWIRTALRVRRDYPEGAVEYAEKMKLQAFNREADYHKWDAIYLALFAERQEAQIVHPLPPEHGETAG